MTYWKFRIWDKINSAILTILKENSRRPPKSFMIQLLYTYIYYTYNLSYLIRHCFSQLFTFLKNTTISNLQPAFSHSLADRDFFRLKKSIYQCLEPILHMENLRDLKTGNTIKKWLSNICTVSGNILFNF